MFVNVVDIGIVCFSDQDVVVPVIPLEREDKKLKGEIMNERIS